MTPQVLLYCEQFGVETSKPIGTGLNARRDETKQFNVKVAIFIHLFVGDFSFGEMGRGGFVRHVFSISSFVVLHRDTRGARPTSDYIGR